MPDAFFYSTLGVFWLFGFAAVLLIAWHMRNRRRIEKLKIIHEERMKAMEKGIPLPEFPELKEERSIVMIDHTPMDPRWTLGAGIVLVAGGLGLMVAMRQVGNELWPYGLVAVFVGIGMVLFYALTRESGAGADQ